MAPRFALATCTRQRGRRSAMKPLRGSRVRSTPNSPSVRAVGFRLRREAEACIEAIAPYTAEDSPSAAQRWYDEMNAATSSLARCLAKAQHGPRCGKIYAPFRWETILSCAAKSTSAPRSFVSCTAQQWQDLLQGILVSFGGYWQARGQLSDHDMYCYKYGPAQIL
jgi:plasmid stabilization system protein ParE